MKKHTLIALAALVSLAATPACRSAKISHSQRGLIHGRILDADSQHVYVNETGSNRVQAIPRQEIRHIQHPGKGTIITGLIIGAVYGTATFAILAFAEEGDTLAPATAASGPAIFGLSMALYGRYIRRQSIEAAARDQGDYYNPSSPPSEPSRPAPERSPPAEPPAPKGPKLVPIVYPDKQGGASAGAGMIFEF